MAYLSIGAGITIRFDYKTNNNVWQDLRCIDCLGGRILAEELVNAS